MGRLAVRFLGKMWPGLVLAVAVALALGLTPADGLLSSVRLPLAALIVLCTIGKALFDTLFYDHYWP